MQQLLLPENALPTKLIFDPEQPMGDDAFYEFCVANPDMRIERTAQGEIVIVPPAGGESDAQSSEVIMQLGTWATRQGRGRFFGMTVMFLLPTGAAFSPDAAWVSNDRLAKLSKEQRRKFLPISPDFVVEVMSPSDRLPLAKAKMQEWLRAGVELGWLIHGDTKTIYIFRAGEEKPEPRIGVPSIAGEGPVAGFDLDLTRIWAGL
jgi:Uma2 family endonuclease